MNPEQDLEIEIDFSDITLSEVDGVFEEVKKKMEEGFPHQQDWMIRTDFSISSKFGMGQMLLHLYGNGNIYIMSYIPSIGDVFYNPDITSISEWADQNGWKKPQPHRDLIRENKEFWKHFYDTYLLDSDYLDEVYGKRPQYEEKEEGDTNDS